MSHKPHERGFPLVDQGKDSLSGIRTATMNNAEGVCTLENLQYEAYQGLDHNYYATFGNAGYGGEDFVPHISSYLPSICPPPSAFLGPKCALWDCPRPAQGLEWCQDYCSSFHAALALNEGPPGMGPVVRPRGIGLKDGLLFAALSAKALGKDVGIPECEGAATAKSPWNAPGEIFFLLSKWFVKCRFCCVLLQLKCPLYVLCSVILGWMQNLLSTLQLKCPFYMCYVH